MIAALDFEAVAAALTSFAVLARRLCGSLVADTRKEYDFRRTAKAIARHYATAASLVLPKFQYRCHPWPLLLGAPAHFAIGILPL